MNPIASELNRVIDDQNPHVMSMLSAIGKELFFPKGILSQSAEAKQKAFRLNATIGIATENGRTMCFPSVMASVAGIEPESALTYAPSFGLPELRQIWRDSLYQKNPSLRGQTVSLPIVTCGITHALSIFADVWVNPGDVIILPDMIWGNYNMIFGVRKGVRMSHYPLFAESGGFNLEAFEAQVRKEAGVAAKIIVLLNFPHNPTGYTATRAEGERIAAILKEVAAAGTQVIVVTDDAYFGLFYEAETLEESIFALFGDADPNLLAVKLDGATKENFVWGLRIGFITYVCRARDDATALYDALEKKTAGCVRGNISNASHLGQRMVIKSMQGETYAAEKTEKFSTLKRRAHKVKEVLADPRYRDAWEAYPFNSGYFMCIRLKDEKVNAEALRQHLLDRYGVGLISLGDRNLRVAFSCLEEGEIPELFDIVLKGIEDLKSAHT